jgi:Fic family protein
MKFNSNYTITNKILNNLTLISSSREFIEQAYLIPKWEISLKRQALLHNTHASTAIEGNRLSLQHVKDLAEGKKVISTNKDKQEVLNYLEALEKMPDLVKKGQIRVADLLNIHKIITKATLKQEACCGNFRKQQVFVGKRIFDGTGFKEEVVYMPPDTADVPELVKIFIDWLNLEETWEINPVLLAGIAHYEIARIHPFIDGNGRTARLLAALLIYLSGFDHRRFFALDDYYDRDRNSYYSALKTVDKETCNLTKWLEYFSEGVLFSVNEVKESIIKLGAKKKTNRDKQIILTKKQVKIIEYINSAGKVTNKDLQNLFDVSAQAVHKELTKLLELNIIKSEGQGRAVHYILID